MVEVAALCRQELKFRYKEDAWRSSSTRLIYTVWLDHFPHVQIPRLSEFSQCNFCARASKKKLNQKMTNAQKAQLDKDKAGADPRRLLTNR